MLANLPIMPQLRAADAGRAKQFYTEKLGLPLLMDMGEVFVVGSGNGTTLVVYQQEEHGPPSNTVASWQTDDIQAAARDLQGRGVRLERYEIPGVEYDDLGIAWREGVGAVWFEDTEGNILQVVQVGG